MLIDPNLWLTQSLLNVMVAFAIGIQIDFNKHPFRAISIGARLKEVGAKLTVKK